VNNIVLESEPIIFRHVNNIKVNNIVLGN
jgi:hypothetical protein